MQTLAGYNGLALITIDKSLKTKNKSSVLSSWFVIIINIIVFMVVVNIIDSSGGQGSVQ